MDKYEEQVRKIVSLKRYETPRDGYFEDFLEEFQQRQRSELLQKSSTGLFFERVATWFRELGSIKWVAGAGVAYAALMVAILMWPDTTPTQQDGKMQNVIYQPGEGQNPPPKPKPETPPTPPKF